MLRMLRMLLVALLAAACAWPARAELPDTPQPRQFSVFDGLPSNRINALAEDRSGYLWIATGDGLARYDGLGFRVWRAEQGLRDSAVWSVLVDARDRVWIGTSKAGLAMLDAERRSFRYFSHADDPRIAEGEIWALAATPDGAIWFGTDGGGLHRMAADGGIARFMPRAGDPRSLPDARVTQLAVAPDGTLWVATRGGSARWTGRDFERLPPAADGSNGLAFEPDGTLWLANIEGAMLRTPGGRLARNPWGDQRDLGTLFHVLRVDRGGSYWVDVSEGLGRIHQGRLGNVPLYSASARGIVKPSWSGGFEDRGGGLWFASVAHGLWHLPADWRRFSVLARRAGDDASPGNAHVRAIAPSSDGSLWLVGSGGALDRLDPDTGHIEHALRDIGTDYMPLAVHEDRDGRVWIGYDNGIARFDPASGALVHWTTQDAADAALPVVRSFAEGGDGLLWMASSQGVQARAIADGAVREAVSPQGAGQSREGALSPQLRRAPDGGLWLSGLRGLQAWNAGARRFEPLPGIAATPVYGYAIDDAGDTVWVGRVGALERYRWDGARLHLAARIDAANGMPQVAPNGLVIDGGGRVWVTTGRGLVRVDPITRAVRLYGVRDGLPSQELMDPPVVDPGDGRIVVGTAEGLVLFDPGVVRPRIDVPELMIETVAVRRGAREIEFAPDAPFVLRDGDRDLRVVARLRSLDGAAGNRYRFRLLGYDQDWVETGAGGERLFPRLPPGRYRLQVKAGNADNAWSAVRTLAFEAHPPWWRTWWAYALLGALLALSAFLALREYRTRLRRRHAWQLSLQKRALAEQASEAKTRFLATLGHEVRTPMTGVLGMSELLMATPLDDTQRGYARSIQRAGEHLVRLVNDALDLSRIEAGKLELDVQDFDLRALVDEVVALMAPLARQRGLAFDATVDADVARWMRGDATRVRQVLMNLLGNAVKFTAQGSVALRVAALAPHGVRVVVSDTGPGLNEEQRQRLFGRFEQAEGARTAARYGGSGLGLAICQELAAAMGGRIDVDSAPGDGARFSVELPLPPGDAPAAETPAQFVHGAARELLLVEDDATVAAVIVGLLQGQGHRVAHVAHGLAALAEIAARDAHGLPFDLALLDLDLPGIDGLALARQLRAQGFDRPLLAVTARADADAEPQARAAGFDGFLRKPLTGGMLADAIEALLPTPA